jgi:hypothetical protein
MEITIEELTNAMHLFRHEQGDKWPVQDGCGCAEWATGLWTLLKEVQATEQPKEAAATK